MGLASTAVSAGPVLSGPSNLLCPDTRRSPSVLILALFLCLPRRGPSCSAVALSLWLRRLWAVRAEDGLVIPREMVERLQRSRLAFFAIDVVEQAKRALFDQLLFGPQPTAPPAQLQQLIHHTHPVHSTAAHTARTPAHQCTSTAASSVTPHHLDAGRLWCCVVLCALVVVSVVRG